MAQIIDRKRMGEDTHIPKILSILRFLGNSD